MTTPRGHDGRPTTRHADRRADRSVDRATDGASDRRRHDDAAHAHAAARTDAGGARAPGSATGAARTFDGVVVFGGVDWWYHNRGHYDLRMARRFARRMPVVYVNSIGMRVPDAREGRVFVRRIARKLRSLRRGGAAVDPWTGRTLDEAPAPGAPGLHVVTIPWWPGRRGRGLALPRAIRRLRDALEQAGVEHPLAWTACPTAWPLLDPVHPVGAVYQRTDRYERFPGVDADEIAVLDRRHKQRADVTLFCAESLLGMEGPQCRRAALVDHGVDLARFDAIGDVRRHGGAEHAEPPALAGIPRPRVGFVGAIDPHTFDPALMDEVIRRMPDAQFVLVGASTLPDGALDHPNVHRLGRVEPHHVAAYMHACDVLVMPWRRSKWIDACHPVKTREYLAAGKPVVTTPFADAVRYGDHLTIAAGAASFSEAIRRAVDAPPSPEHQRAAVDGCDWNDRFDEVLELLGDAGLHPVAPDARAAVVEGRIAYDHDLNVTLPAAIRGGVTHPAAIRGGGGTAQDDRHPNPRSDDRAASDARPEGSPAMHIDRSRVFAAQTIEALPAPTIAPAARRPDGLAAVFLMAGGPEPSPIERIAKRSVLDLPIAGPEAPIETPSSVARGGVELAPTRLVDRWMDALGSVPANGAGVLPVRVVAGSARPVPWPQVTHPEALAPHLRVRFERDPAAFRGVIGVLRDLGRGLDPDDHILVLEAGRLPQADLGALVRGHLASGADVTCAVANAEPIEVFASPADGAPLHVGDVARIAEPAGAWCLRACTLGFAPPAGWCDLKEQWLPRVIEAGGIVRAAELPAPGLPAIRDEAGLLEAIRIDRAHRHGAIDEADAGPDAGRTAGLPVRIIEPGARVAPSALVNDAVVLAGAVIAGGDVVADTVVGPGRTSRTFRRTAA